MFQYKNNFLLKIPSLIIVAVTMFFGVNGYAQPACLGEQGKLIWNMWDESSDDDMAHLSNFPFKPARTEILSDLGTPNTTYSSNYTSYIRGYLKIPQTGDYIFNVTGDDDVHFFLSTGEGVKEAEEIATVPGWAEQEDYFKYGEQTSETKTLQADQYYYFELLHREGGGSDHFKVSWKTPFATDTAFQLITAPYFFDYTCNLDCPEKGIACDDNDPNTLDDVQDGYCNCFGTPQTQTAPVCIGEKGAVDILYYDDITGDRLTHLYFDSSYPLNPTRGEKLEELTLYNSQIDNYGSVIKGYLSVPVTGTYYFNITGIRRAGLKISATEHPEEAVFVAYYDASSGIGTYNHDQESTQTSQGQVLEKGKYYYIEINHKASTNSDYLNIYWKTPFYEDDRWRRLTGNYLYNYDPDCAFPCYPEGTPCDDGSAATMRDTFNANCLCVGIPCPNNDCGEGAEETAYQAPETCGISDELKNEAANAWLSCTDATNPATNSAGKWIQYDLGQIYYIENANIWNYNVPDLTGRGFENVTIHVSDDSSNWSDLGSFSWSEATGLVGYSGFKQDFGVTGRYVIISATSNFDQNNCFGLSKVNFAVYDCLNVGKSCDDGNALTANDIFDENCKCAGTTPTVENFCSRVTRVHSNIPIDPNNYDAEKTIESEAILLTDYDVSYVAGESISLLPGFHAQVGSQLLAMIEECSTVASVDEIASKTIIRPYDVGNLYSFPPKDDGDSTGIVETGTRLILGTPQNLGTTLEVSPNPTKDWAMFDFNIPSISTVTLKIFAANGQEVATLIDNQTIEAGAYQKEFYAQNFAKGIYLVTLTTESTVITKNLAVIE